MTSCNYGSVFVGLAALLGIAANAGCGSDNNTGSGAQTAGAGGAAAGAVGAGTAGTSGGGAGGVASAGAPAGGASTASGGVSGGGAANGGSSGSATAGAGGATAGSGGAAAGAGTGGASAGAGGAPAGGSAGAGGTAVTFSAVSAIITKSCATAGCHDGTNKHISFKNNLYGALTMALPAGTDRCVGSTLVVPSNTTTSFLLTAIKTGGACPKGGSAIGRMPDNCSAAANAQNPCLSTAQIQTITDWITAGAPM